MHDAHRERRQPTIHVNDGLYAWRGGQVVLLGERADGRWVLARGWPDSDRLTDVRRWHFERRDRFALQVLRLVREATGNEREAVRARDAALNWTDQAASPLPEPALDGD